MDDYIISSTTFSHSLWLCGIPTNSKPIRILKRYLARMRSNPEVFCALLCSTVLPLPEGGRQDSAESPEREDGRSLEENYKDEKSSPESAEMPLQKTSATQDPLVTAPPKDSKDDEANSTTAKPAMPNILPKADHFDMPMKTAPVPASVQETGRTNSEFWAFSFCVSLVVFSNP